MRGIAGVRHAAAAIVALALAFAAAAGERQNVVMQINDDDPAHWRQALGTVRNLLNEVGADNVQEVNRGRRVSLRTGGFCQINIAMSGRGLFAPDREGALPMESPFA